MGKWCQGQGPRLIPDPHVKGENWFLPPSDLNKHTMAHVLSTHALNVIMFLKHEMCGIGLEGEEKNKEMDFRAKNIVVQVRLE